MTQQINLYNPAFLKRNPALEPGALLVYGLAFVLLAGGAIAARVRIDLDGRARELAALVQQVKAEQATTASLAAQKAAVRKNSALEAEAVRLEARAIAGEENLAYIRSGALGNSEGFSELMRALSRQTLEGLWLTGFSVDGGGSAVVLRGRMFETDLLPSYISRLGREKAFEGRRFDSLSIGGAAPQVSSDGRPSHVGFEIVAHQSSAIPSSQDRK